MGVVALWFRFRAQSRTVAISFQFVERDDSKSHSENTNQNGCHPASRGEYGDGDKLQVIRGYPMDIFSRW